MGKQRKEPEKVYNIKSGLRPRQKESNYGFNSTNLKMSDKKREEIREVIKKYPANYTNYYFKLIKKQDDAICKQCVPDIRELHDEKGLPDPLCEERDSPVPGLVHRYPDRVLLLVSNSCAMYCRFCTRKRRVGDPDKKISFAEVNRGINYIKAHREVRDVLISGGDPLMLKDEELERILKAIRKIKHVEIIRIGTRIPCVNPARVTPKLCNMLKKYHPLYINTHFNHPSEITPQSTRACTLLADAGIPLGNQSVLLKGVNDDAEIMKELVQKLLTIRVKPYYLYMPDLVEGTSHFRPSLDKAISIMKSLKGFTTGMAVPQLIIDAEGGLGKIVVPYSEMTRKGKKVFFKNYKGETVVYDDV